MTKLVFKSGALVLFVWMVMMMVDAESKIESKLTLFSIISRLKLEWICVYSDNFSTDFFFICWIGLDCFYSNGGYKCKNEDNPIGVYGGKCQLSSKTNLFWCWDHSSYGWHYCYKCPRGMLNKLLIRYYINMIILSFYCDFLYCLGI